MEEFCGVSSVVFELVGLVIRYVRNWTFEIVDLVGIGWGFLLGKHLGFEWSLLSYRWYGWVVYDHQVCLGSVIRFGNVETGFFESGR